MGMWLLWGNFALIDFTLWVSSIIMEKGNCLVTSQLRKKIKGKYVGKEKGRKKS
ncbi:MAG: hypothetical protein ACLT0H_08055 [Lachnospiraceae bacterium]